MKNFIQKFFIKKLPGIIFSIWIVSLLTGNILAQSKKVPGEEIFTLGCLKNSFSDVDINDATAAIKVWGQEFEKRLKLEVKFDLKLFENINEMIKSSAKDNFGLIVLTSVDYLKYKSKMQIYPSFIPAYCQEFLVLAKRDKFKNLLDLKGKKLGMIKMDYNPIPGMWLDVFLGRNKQKQKQKFFSSIKEFNNEAQLILSVFFDQNEVCIVSKTAFETMKELNPQVEKNLIILAQSPCFITGMSCLTKNSKNFSYINKLIEGIIKLESYPEGRQILALMKTEKVRPIKPDDLENVEKLLRDYDALGYKN